MAAKCKFLCTVHVCALNNSVDAPTGSIRKLWCHCVTADVAGPEYENNMFKRIVGNATCASHVEGS